ncbi:hypothetical protein ZHAS_00016954 [Anopheles sinensis]|uniref:Uncharacterized protein n=1 Tax=Anopheles sinensis TaxID=74873 RepID=A0A084WFF9_ANOSI|nr:hypothetical protein ZHAS_00016954 [Anopheles sinensis]
MADAKFQVHLLGPAARFRFRLRGDNATDNNRAKQGVAETWGWMNGPCAVGKFCEQQPFASHWTGCKCEQLQTVRIPW